MTTTTGVASSRLGTGKRAVRKATKARLALSGPSGAGKTWTALSVAQVLAKRIVVIDTEPADDLQGAASLYAENFSFDVIEWQPPYDPRDLALTIRECGRAVVPDSNWPGNHGYEVIVIDSASHFWQGEGGTLDIADGRFGGWKTATPAQDDFVKAILRSPSHIICCTRAKQSYEVSEEAQSGGGTRQKVQKLGLAPIQRGDLEYEFQVVAMMDEAHRIDIGKTRAEPLAGKSYHAGSQSEFADVYKEWIERGITPARASDVEAIRLVMTAKLKSVDEMTKLRKEFKDEFGQVDFLDEEKVPTAYGWIRDQFGFTDHPYNEVDGRCVVCGGSDFGPWHVSAPAESTDDDDPVTHAHADPDEDLTRPFDEVPDLLQEHAETMGEYHQRTLAESAADA